MALLEEVHPWTDFESQMLMALLALALLCGWELSGSCSYHHACHMLPCLPAMIDVYPSWTVCQNISFL